MSVSAGARAGPAGSRSAHHASLLLVFCLYSSVYLVLVLLELHSGLAEVLWRAELACGGAAVHLGEAAEEHGVGSGAETPGHDDEHEGYARGGGERVDSQRGGLSTLAEGSQKALVRVGGAR